jgi:hypothetical protein
VQVLTLRLDFHGFVGVGLLSLSTPAGVCANYAVIVVSEHKSHRISVFKRGDGALLRRFGSEGTGDRDGQLNRPHGPCFMSGRRHVAVADFGNNRAVGVFSVEGELRVVRHVSVGNPHGAACSAFDELVAVADIGNFHVVVFSASGDSELLKMLDGDFRGVAIHGGTIFAQDYDNSKCILFK